MNYKALTVEYNMKKMILEQIRLKEAQEGKYCMHVLITTNDDDIIITRDGKKVCNGCCNHSSGFGPFINKALKEVCLMCCNHKINDTDNFGNRFCYECGLSLPQSFNVPSKQGKVNDPDPRSASKPSRVKKQPKKRKKNINHPIFI